MSPAAAEFSGLQLEAELMLESTGCEVVTSLMPLWQDPRVEADADALWQGCDGGPTGWMLRARQCMASTSSLPASLPCHTDGTATLKPALKIQCPNTVHLIGKVNCDKRVRFDVQNETCSRPSQSTGHDGTLNGASSSPCCKFFEILASSEHVHEGLTDVSRASPSEILYQTQASADAAAELDASIGLRFPQCLKHSPSETIESFRELPHSEGKSLSLTDHLVAHSPGSVEELEAILQHCNGQWFDFWRHDVQTLCLPWRLIASNDWGPPPLGVPTAFRVYVDGSARGGRAGYGLILFAWHGCAWCYVGWAGGHVHDGRFATNNGAESMGLLIAACWALSVPAWVHVELIVDSEFSQGSALGTIALSSSCDDDPAKLLRKVVQIHEHRRARLEVCWTRGHAGDFGNELADRVADYFQHGRGPCCRVPRSVTKLLAHPLLAWAWAAGRKVRDLPSLSHLAKGNYETRDVLPLECAQAVCADVSKLARRRRETVRLRICTANVCTLKHKGAILRKQLEQEKVHIFALQETRLSSDAVYLSDGWVVIHSAALKGRDGCAFWVNTSAMADELELLGGFGCKAVTVLQARPDWLVIRLKVAGVDLVLVTYHAPHSLQPENVIRAWWRQAHQDLAGVEHIAQLLFLGDANATVSRHDQEVVGSLAGAQADIAGDCLVGICSRFRLALFNTLPSHDFPESLQKTWKHKCLDYIAAPCAWHGLVEACRVEVDLCNVHEDHEALCVLACIPCVDSDVAIEQPRSVRNHGSATAWASNVHIHAESLFARARQQQKRCQVAVKPRKPYVSERSWFLLRAKKANKKRILEIRKAFERETLLICWAALRGRERSNERRIGWVVQEVRAVFTLHAVRRDLVRQLDADKREYISNLGHQVKGSANAGATKEMFRALNFFRPAGKRVKKPFKALPLLRDKSGVVADSFAAQQEQGKTLRRYGGGCEHGPTRSRGGLQ